MPATDARDLVFSVLHAVEDGAFSDVELSRALNACQLGANDRALATVMVYGTLAWQGRLDHTLSTLSNRALKRMDSAVRILLRMGLFQMAFLDRVPDYAAVDTTVVLARRHARAGGGFINAVLRRASREGLAELPSKPAAERLAVEFSHPRWLVDRWLKAYGPQRCRQLLEADNEPQPTVLRALIPRQKALAALQDAGVQALPARHAPQGMVVKGRIPHCPGIAVAQGEASQLAVCMLAPRRGERVLDACAAPGGKTAYIAALVGGQGSVVACDPALGAAEPIGATLQRAGVAMADAEDPAVATDTARVSFHNSGISGLDPTERDFDAVLVDAPCSGLGTLRQHPEVRWRRRPSDIAASAVRQRAVLMAASARTRSGGRLLYATCTMEPEENDAVVDAFLAENPSFYAEGADQFADCLGPVLDKGGRLRTYPDRDGTDGFFAVRLARRS